MSESRKYPKWLTFGHFVLGGAFLVIFSSQALVFSLAFRAEGDLTWLVRLGVASSIGYAVLGVLWLVVGFLLSKQASKPLIMGLSIASLLFLPFGPLLSVPALIYAKKQP